MHIRLSASLYALGDELGSMQVLFLAGSTLTAALCVLGLKSLPQVQEPANSPAAKLKSKVSSFHVSPCLHKQQTAARMMFI